MTQNGQGPEPQYPAVPPAHDAHGGAQSWDGAWGPAAGRPGGQPLPPAQPLPPETAPEGADAQSTQYLPPVPPRPGYGYPPPAADAQSTQYLPPVPPRPGYGYPPPAADAQSTQYLPPVPGAMPPAYPGGTPSAPPPQGYGYPPPAADERATQHIPSVPPRQDGGATRFLGTGPLPARDPAPAGASDATQYIAPVPAQEPGERQPPAEFDNLFRTEEPRAPREPRTQAYQQPQAPAPYQQHPQPQGPPPPQRYAHQDAYYDAEPEPPRRKSPIALIAVVVAGCAVVGLGAGALLSGGDEKETPEKGGQNVVASSAAPSADAPSEKPVDPAEPQARELSKLLADSSSSRDTVISSVELIKQCRNLDQAASDLRGAAGQRRGLVTRLQSLRVDKIPGSPELTAALTRAWQASAAADDHYAAWADQMKAKKACKGGKARSTNRTVAATEKSGEATAAKKRAAGLWNPTAAKYGLEKRAYTQL